MVRKTVLITGVAGLLGSRLAEWVLENTDYRVIGVDDLSGGYEENIPNGVNFYELNLSKTDFDEEYDIRSVEGPSLYEYKTLKDVFEDNNPEYVFHFAAYAAEGLSPFIRCFNYENNLVATANIVNMCIKYNVTRLVFTSSMAVYGNQETPFHEGMIPQPIDPYGVAKYACEMDIQIAGEQHGLDWCIIRPHNVYGVNQNIWDKYRNVLGIWMYQHLNGKPMTIFGDGEQTRAFSYIDDSLQPLWNSAVREEASKQIINLGGIYETSIKDACDVLRQVIEDDAQVLYLEPRHEVKHAHSTYQKSVDVLDFEHSTNLKNGISQMWEWARKQPMRTQFTWSEYELDKGIYGFWK
jgi:UDP-glucose 4-epimerase